VAAPLLPLTTQQETRARLYMAHGVRTWRPAGKPGGCNWPQFRRRGRYGRRRLRARGRESRRSRCDSVKTMEHWSCHAGPTRSISDGLNTRCVEGWDADPRSQRPSAQSAMERKKINETDQWIHRSVRVHEGWWAARSEWVSGWAELESQAQLGSPLFSFSFFSFYFLLISFQIKISVFEFLIWVVDPS
jgi:hypothetical protein